jgi:glutathione S-transferase
MERLELIQLYPSPWSERLRWVLEWKAVPYARREYQPLAGEEELRRTTGHSTVPVLLADGRVIGDSDAAADWIEERHPARPLMPPPADALARALVRAWELMGTECLAPFARLVMIGRWKAAGMQPLADHFAAKYGWSPEAGERAGRVLERTLADLARAVGSAGYLVGGGFTRADLTLACMLTPTLGAPPDELFALDEGMRALFGLPVTDGVDLAPLRAWRDEIYRRHRGGRVTPDGSA